MSEPGQSSGQPGTESDGESAFYPSWLGRLAAEIGSAVGGQILRVSDGRVSGELGRWPDLSAEEPLSPEASRLAQEAVTEREGRFAPLQLAFTDGKAGREAWLLAYPVLSAGEAQAVVVLQLALDSAAGLQRAMQQAEAPVNELYATKESERLQEFNAPEGGSSLLHHRQDVNLSTSVAMKV
mgnify:CR=1 FL=1